MRLDGHIECGGRLIGQQQAGAAGEGHGDHDSLPHAAGELVRVFMQAALGLRNAHLAQHLQRARHAGIPGEPLMHHHRLGDLPANGQHRVQAAHGLLENHRDRAAANTAHFRIADPRQVLIIEQHPAGADPPIGARQQPQDGQRGEALATTGFAHDAQRLATAHGEGEIIHRDNGRPLAGGEFGAQPLNGENHLRHHNRRARRGSSISRRPSPRILMESTISARKTLGKRIFQKAICT